MFLKLYPDAHILCVDPGSFTKEKRTGVLEEIKDNNYDGIIMAYSCFELIPPSAQNKSDKLRRERTREEIICFDSLGIIMILR